MGKLKWTGKGVAASGSDSFATLANKIGQIQSQSYPLGFPVDVSTFKKISYSPPIAIDTSTIDSTMTAVPSEINYLFTSVVNTSGWGWYRACLADFPNQKAYMLDCVGMEGSWSFTAPDLTVLSPGDVTIAFAASAQVASLYVNVVAKKWAVNTSNAKNMIASN